MPQKFVPGSVGVHDAAGQYDQARRFYLHVAAVEGELDQLVATAETNLAKAEVSRPELVSDAEKSVEQAKDAQATVRSIKVKTMIVYVTLMGDFIKSIESTRKNLEGTAVESSGALDQFDLDLSRLKERYQKLYLPLVEKAPPVSEWTPQLWDKFYTHVSGPVLLWENGKTCEENWKAMGVTPCRGPDYLLTWSLANQSDIAAGVQIQAELEYAKAWKYIADTSEILSDLVESVVTGLVTIVAKAVKQATGFGLGSVLLIGGGFWIALQYVKGKR